ncbi:hypothetical protein HNR46_003560 [Haloferula luteola]|uniref:Uncharacterized protein n=1 Tax=Haloferula luteola TaxID=595692 RepID=A0A840V5K7_9BACT|nr:hypothetical protein [Haloferula luteola]
MKTIATILVLASGMLMPILAEQTTIRIDARYEGVDVKWLSDLSPNTREVIKATGGTLRLPAVTAKAGETATIEVIQEFHTGTPTPKESVVPCGVVVDWSPEPVGGAIRISGKNLLRRTTNKNADGVATRFETQEAWINLNLEDGATKLVELEDGGKMFITATLVDSSGRPVKK